MTGYAFALVTLVIVALVVVIAAQIVLLNRARQDVRRVTDRLLNAMLAENAKEMAELDRASAVDFLQAEVRAQRAERTGPERTRSEPTLPVPHGMG